MLLLESVAENSFENESGTVQRLGNKFVKYTLMKGNNYLESLYHDWQASHKERGASRRRRREP